MKKDDMYANARKQVLLGLKKKVAGSQAEGLKESLKAPMKVSVMADSEEGLKKGLEKAEEVLDSKEAMMEKLKDALSKEAKESEEEEVDLEEVESEDEIDALMAQLEAKKKALKGLK
jgi:spore cortex formation protein SpoVR/YcgB (stage V sporulation)